MKKLVLRVDLHEEKEKKKAMSKVSGISGVISVALDMKEKKMTVIGEVDAVEVACKLRRLCNAEIVTVGEDKEEKKDESKNGGGGGGEAYSFYHPQMYYYPVMSSEENPNTCVIC